MNHRDPQIERDERFWKTVRDVFACRPLPEPTYCDGCKRFSRGNVCPYCPPPSEDTTR
jgi:hypothetical protein